MTNDIQLFSYGDNAVRFIERDGVPYWVAKDVCNILGYANHIDAIAKMLDDDERDLQILDTSSGKRNMTVISESGLYSLIFRSTKPQAKEFRKWVTGTMLPQIRKNGSHSPEPAKLTKSIMYSAKMIFEAAGIKDNQLALALDKIIAHYTGKSMLALSGVVLEAPNHHQLLTPALIGRHFGVSGRKVNDILSAEGYQHKVGNGYKPLELGEPFAVMIDTAIWDSDGSPVRMLKWDSSILDELKPAFALVQ